MACYAAVLSLFHTLNHINIHPRPPISLDQSQVDSLSRNLSFFQDFLERYSSEENDELESRIAVAAYSAEDVIESHIVSQIDDAGSTSDHGETIDSGLEKVIEDMDLIKSEVMHIIQEKIMRPQHHPHLHTNSSVSTASRRPASTKQSSTTPVFDDAQINEVLDKLTGQQSSLQIISIVGMGGIGKTTFARNIYANPLIVQYFDALAWVTISQEYSRGNIFKLLCQEFKGSISGVDGKSEDEIGVILYKYLWGRRYLIVMDDIWSIDVWDIVKFYFPDNNNRSRIMITTRLSNLASMLNSCHVFQIQFLDENKSWGLLREIVFGKLDCPVELENIGNAIARKCKGLPLGIAVIGGLLKRSNMTKKYWLYTLENLNLLINLEDDEYTLRILRTSYKELPIHLKPCFLYIGLFPEDSEIKVSMLIKLWVVEGILRPADNKSLEEVAEDYMKELIDRNLISVSELRWDGEARLCKIHDLLRDICLREAQKQKLFCILRQQKHHTPRNIEMERRICIHPEKKYVAYSPQFLHAVESASHTRSLLYKMPSDLNREGASPSLWFRLLRVFSPIDQFDSNAMCSDNAIFKQSNLRYLFVILNLRDVILRLFSLSSQFWNLQILEARGCKGYYFEPIIAPLIWEMPVLRHVKLINFVLPDPPGEGNFVLENLQTLSGIINFKFSEAVLKRIPNIRKLRVIYEREEDGLPDFYLNNLGYLQKMESLNLDLSFRDNCDVEKIGRSLVSFPQSLKKLSLCRTRLSWDDLTTRIGSLPHLQFLTLQWNACVGTKWETVEENFYSLRILKLSFIDDLKYWETESTHFPRLEHLHLRSLKQLEEISSSIGDIWTLKTIRLDNCNRSAEASAIRIKGEQKENGNEDLEVETFQDGRSSS